MNSQSGEVLHPSIHDIRCYSLSVIKDKPVFRGFENECNFSLVAESYLSQNRAKTKDMDEVNLF